MRKERKGKEAAEGRPGGDLPVSGSLKGRVEMASNKGKSCRTESKEDQTTETSTRQNCSLTGAKPRE